MTSRFSYFNKAFFFLFAFTVLAFTSFAQTSPKVSIPVFKGDILPNPLKAEVIGIQDGDTIELKLIFNGRKAGHRTGKPLRIRFQHINTPERGRPYYKVAKEFTSAKCFRKVVRIRHQGEFDKYGRLIGEIILADGTNLNKQLVKNGLAVHFKKYSSDAEYARIEREAQKQKLAIWSLPGAGSARF
ncbi:thermonuclease family protein [Dyadobacter sandarakinus]|uniref:Thermonuclease family protein n=1 Tax=Dyadobacter sandarakinus TaxID=2747268 RepID=A0ABX7ICW0_9BACT|nr:thermonuclease family protein [Dyadobacter sandarakinus]QRR03367.1 thermonuclease family protein [Dyadobacter sandarakinus]